MATVFARNKTIGSKYGTVEETTALLNVNVAPLGVPIDEKRSWWQRRARPDPDAIATQAGGRSIVAAVPVD